MQKNFTQEQVADQIGVSRQKYARIESGVNSVTLDILSKVAEVLGVTVGDITRVLDESPVVKLNIEQERKAHLLKKRYLICLICFMRISICVQSYSTRI